MHKVIAEEKIFIQLIVQPVECILTIASRSG